MKRVLLIPALALVGALAFGQEASVAASLGTGDRYEVYSERGADDAKTIAAALDVYYGLFDAVFHFDGNWSGRKLRVRMTADKDSFDSYLQGALGSTRDDVVYLHYSRPERCELVLFPKDGGVFDRSFAHQAFVQYLRAYVPNPPVWLREGFAIFFESARYDPAVKSISFGENLAWLETVKAMGSALPSVQDILLAGDDRNLAPEKLYPASWAFVSFLANAQQEAYHRFLWEAILLLDPAADAAANSLAVAERGQALVKADQAEKDFLAYLGQRKTFAELVDQGRSEYASKDYVAAEQSFIAAAELRNDHYAPHYYLGLLAYARGEYALAETHYRTALQMGAEEAVVDYALGVNAAADGRSVDAVTYLEKAKELAPARYASRVDDLVKRLR